MAGFDGLTKEEHKVREAIALILADRKNYVTSLNWAVNYCKAAMVMEGDALKNQVLYILNNIQHWRHPKAKEVRKVLKEFGGQS